VFDVRAVLQGSYHDLSVADLPPLLVPRLGTLGLIDYEKAFCSTFKNGPDIFDLRGVDREQGALVVVRPDQHVAHVVALDDVDELSAFFGRFLIDQRT
jgi:phenol 2-monooxygenase